MIVGDDVGHAAHATGNEALQEDTPMDLGLGDGARDAEHPAALIASMPIAESTAASRTTPASRTFS